MSLATFLNWNKVSQRTVYNKMADRIFDTLVLEFRLMRVFGKYSIRISEGRRTIMTDLLWVFTVTSGKYRGVPR
jgi:hypothetical protein